MSPWHVYQNNERLLIEIKFPNEVLVIIVRYYNPFPNLEMQICKNVEPKFYGKYNASIDEKRFQNVVKKQLDIKKSLAFP